MNREILYLVLVIFFAVTTLLFIILWAVSGEDEIVLIDDITPGTQTDAHYDVLIKNNHFFPIPKKTIKKTIDSMTYTLVIDKAIPGKKSETATLILDGSFPDEEILTVKLF